MQATVPSAKWKSERENSLALGSLVALLPEQGILKTEVVFPAIILGVPLCFFPLSLFLSPWLGKQSRPDL